ncbi:MAG TPA: VOC family protein [Burkholderiales bacterium]|nr:VOC family protein [Burkholderiales bacterium]
MLTRAPVMTMLPVKDLERARDFYVNKLGLEAEGLAADGKFVLRASGTKLGLIPKPEGTKAEHTTVGFEVDDVAAEIKTLKGRGVKFEDYDFPGFKTVDHVIVIGTDKAAWFKDTEGNILCLHQDLRKRA